jgi:Transglutaminase-like superfamily
MRSSWLLGEGHHRRVASGRRRVRLARSLISNRPDLWLALRMGAWRLLLPILKRTLPLTRLARLMWDGSRTERPRPGREARIAELASVVFRSEHQRGFENCLDRSLVLYRYLSAVGADPELRVGFRKQNGSVEGHAWVSVRGDPVRETPGALDDLEQVVTFKGGMPSTSA